VGVIPMHVGMLLVGVSGGLNNLLMLFVGYSGGHLVGGRVVGGPYTLFFFFVIPSSNSSDTFVYVKLFYRA
jgi:hypothetical protein